MKYKIKLDNKTIAKFKNELDAGICFERLRIENRNADYKIYRNNQQMYYVIIKNTPNTRGYYIPGNNQIEKAFLQNELAVTWKKQSIGDWSERLKCPKQ